MEDTTTTPIIITRVRPTFLTVICILTFLYSGWSVVKAVQSYTTADAISVTTKERMSKAEDKLDQQDTPGFLKTIVSSASSIMDPDNIRKMSIFNLISSLLALVGAIMMWNLKKAGFYVYIMGIIIFVATPIVMLGTGLLGMLSAVWAVVIGGLFIAMYAANLKYMDDRSEPVIS